MLERQEVNLRTMWKSNIDFHTMLISFFENDYVENALQRALSMQYRAYSQLYWKKNKLSKRANPDDFENYIWKRACASGISAGRWRYSGMTSTTSPSISAMNEKTTSVNAGKAGRLAMRCARQKERPLLILL